MFTFSAFVYKQLIHGGILRFSGEEHLDTARAYYGLGCALADLGSLDEAVENLSKAYRLQIRFHASKEDIDRTKQEIDRLQFLCPMAVFSA